jgi:hypothetical protein
VRIGQPVVLPRFGSAVQKVFVMPVCAKPCDPEETRRTRERSPAFDGQRQVPPQLTDRVRSVILALIEGGRRGVDLPARCWRRGNSMVAGESSTKTGGYGPNSRDLLDASDI